ncbi:MAG: site-2 protease family protein [Elusimicrobia bacterium]|nr:site-2 protease family protein [Elusimicrobiota bacterium]
MVALSIIIALGLVVFFHEFGHFISCKLLGIRVLTFAFGFGREIAGFTWGQTRYSLCAFPLGGFTKPAGEDPGELSGAPDEFFAKSWKARILVALAGPWMNYVFSFFLFWFAFWVLGVPEHSKEPVVGMALAGSPALEAGIQAGDRLRMIYAKGGQEKAGIESWDEMSDFIHARPNARLELHIERDGFPKVIDVFTQKDERRGIGLIGITPQVNYRKMGFTEAVIASLRELVHWSVSSLVYLWDKMRRGEKPDLAGPVGIVSMMSKAAKAGTADFLSLLAVISIAIGFFFFFLIPLLDGGHVVLYLWEAVSRRKITRNFLMRANTVGLAILIPVFIFAFYNDIDRVWAGRRAKTKTEFQELIKK